MPKVKSGWYVLVNPHDAYEFRAVDDDVADAVALLLGGGWFGWSQDGREGRVASSIADEVEQAEFVADVQETIIRRQAEVAAALRTVEIEPQAREVLRAEPDDWHRTHRTSFADLRENAHSTAGVLAPLSEG